MCSGKYGNNSDNREDQRTGRTRGKRERVDSRRPNPSKIRRAQSEKDITKGGLQGGEKGGGGGGI